MANTSGNLNLLVIKINEKNAKEQLVKLVGDIDSDFEEVAVKLVDSVMKKYKSLSSQIKAILKTENRREVESTFLLNNDSYCEEYEYELTKVNKEEFILSLAYTT